jgi:hypothetical protein
MGCCGGLKKTWKRLKRKAISRGFTPEFHSGNQGVRQSATFGDFLNTPRLVMIRTEKTPREELGLGLWVSFRAGTGLPPSETAFGRSSRTGFPNWQPRIGLEPGHYTPRSFGRFLSAPFKRAISEVSCFIRSFGRFKAPAEKQSDQTCREHRRHSPKGLEKELCHARFKTKVIEIPQR